MNKRVDYGKRKKATELRKELGQEEVKQATRKNRACLRQITNSFKIRLFEFPRAYIAHPEGKCRLAHGEGGQGSQIQRSGIRLFR